MGPGMKGGSRSVPSPGDPELVPTGDISAGPGHKVLLGGCPSSHQSISCSLSGEKAKD